MKRIVNLFILVSFIFDAVCAYDAQASILSYMPEAGTMIAFSEKADLPLPIGIEFHNNNPFDFNFVLSRIGNSDEVFLRAQAEIITKYFLAALTIPSEDLWVNLSPYEQNRISTDVLAQTELGKDLLGEDYVLKQLTSSLTYPEQEPGKSYWNKIKNNGIRVGITLAVAQNKRAGASPASTSEQTQSFNKVWIVPGEMLIEESNGKVRVVKAELKVMCEEDYFACRQAGLAMQVNNPVIASAAKQSRAAIATVGNSLSCNDATNAFKQYILPLIEQEVNQGKRFAHLRQIYYAVMLAGWFKRKLHDTVLSQTFFDKNKIQGAGNNDPAIREKIYNAYVKAFKQGVYNYVKKDRVETQHFASLQKITKQAYFSGGTEIGAAADAPVIPVSDATASGSLAHVKAVFDAVEKIDFEAAKKLVWQGRVDEIWVTKNGHNMQISGPAVSHKGSDLEHTLSSLAMKPDQASSGGYEAGVCTLNGRALTVELKPKTNVWLTPMSAALASRVDSSVGGAKIDNTLTAEEALMLGWLVRGWLKEQLRLIKIKSEFVSELEYKHDENISAAAHMEETVVKTDGPVDSAIMGSRTSVTYKIVNGALVVTLSVPGHEPTEKLFLISDIKITTEDTFLFAHAVQDWADDLHASAAWAQNPVVGELGNYGIVGTKQLIDQAMAKPGEAVRADRKSPIYFLFDLGKLMVHVELQRGYAQTVEISLGDVRFRRGLTDMNASATAPASKPAEPASAALGARRADAFTDRYSFARDVFTRLSAMVLERFSNRGLGEATIWVSQQCQLERDNIEIFFDGNDSILPLEVRLQVKSNKKDRSNLQLSLDRNTGDAAVVNVKTGERLIEWKVVLRPKGPLVPHLPLMPQNAHEVAPVPTIPALGREWWQRMSPGMSEFMHRARQEQAPAAQVNPVSTVSRPLRPGVERLRDQSLRAKPPLIVPRHGSEPEERSDAALKWMKRGGRHVPEQPDALKVPIKPAPMASTKLVSAAAPRTIAEPATAMPAFVSAAVKEPPSPVTAVAAITAPTKVPLTRSQGQLARAILFRLLHEVRVKQGWVDRHQFQLRVVKGKELAELILQQILKPSTNRKSRDFGIECKSRMEGVTRLACVVQISSTKEGMSYRIDGAKSRIEGRILYSEIPITSTESSDGGVKLEQAANGENIRVQSNGSVFTLDAGWSRPDIKGVRFSIVEVVP